MPLAQKPVASPFGHGTQAEEVVKGIHPKGKTAIVTGASTAVWCATSPLLAAGGGVYCEDCNIAEPVPYESKAMSGVRAWAIDPEIAKRLWTMSKKMLGETFPL